MQKFLPGTTIEVSQYKKSLAEKILANIFVGGGVILSQVCTITGLEPYVVQNWIKRGFVSSPQKRLYSLNQLCRIIIINMLKDSMQLDRITTLISYFSGCLYDEKDDIIGDGELYNLFVNLLATLESKPFTREEIDNAIVLMLCDHKDLNKGDGIRIANVLRIMSYAYYASVYQKTSDRLLNELIYDEKL